MSNCIFSNCPHYGKTSCIFTTVNGTRRCTRDLDGKTFEIGTSITKEESDMGKEELKKRISEELRSKADKYGYVVIPDHFGIGGYMCEVNRIEKFLFPIIDKVLKSND